MADKTFDEVRPDVQNDAHPDAGQVSEGPSGSGQVSEGPSGTGTGETSVGGADSVPATPDTLPSPPAETDPEAAGRKNVRDGSGDGNNRV
jgi:hypothetical protein